MRSLKARLVTIGLAQLALVGLIAVGVAWVTIPFEGRGGQAPHSAAHPSGRGPGPPPNVAEAPVRAPGAGPPPPGRVSRRTGPLVTLLVAALVLAFGAVLTARSIVRPLEDLARAARRVAQGDLAARAKLERRDEIGDVARAFDRMVGRLTTQLEAERSLLANVSHELRTPLARIRVAMDLAAEGDPESAQSALAGIAEDVTELEGLIGDILVAARLDTGRALRADAVRVVRALDLARHGVARAQRRHPERELRLQEDEAALDETLEVDLLLVQRALDNLIGNALRYSDDEVVVALRPHPEGVCFEVRDRGVGIAEEDLARIFEPFFRAERSRERDEGGVGLGLSLVARIARAHGGAVSVRSVLGEGTSMQLVLPRWQASDPLPAGSP